MYTTKDALETIETYQEVSMSGQGYYPSLQDWQYDREKLNDLTVINAIVKAADYINSYFTKRETINKEINSQDISRYLSNRLGEYISNGAVIIAMLMNKYDKTDDYLNPSFNISKKSIL